MTRKKLLTDAHHKARMARLVPPKPEPRYDEIFWEGTRMLDELAGAGPEQEADASDSVPTSTPPETTTPVTADLETAIKHEAARRDSEKTEDRVKTTKAD